jgi:hypothetical protein
MACTEHSEDLHLQLHEVQIPARCCGRMHAIVGLYGPLWVGDLRLHGRVMLDFFFFLTPATDTRTAIAVGLFQMSSQEW